MIENFDFEANGVPLAIGAAVLAGSAYLFKDDIKAMFTKKPLVINPNGTNTNTNTSATNTNTNTTPTSQTQGFPLVRKLGYNPLVFELQKNLNENYGSELKEDGLFGGGTEGELLRLFNSSTVSESLFNQIANHSSSASEDASIMNGYVIETNANDSDFSKNLKRIAGEIRTDISGFQFYSSNYLTKPYIEALALPVKNLIGLAGIYKMNYEESLVSALYNEYSKNTQMISLLNKLRDNNIS